MSSTAIDLQQRADAVVSAYANASRKYVLARRDAALIQACDSRLTSEQVSYWRRIADGCSAIAETAGSAS